MDEFRGKVVVITGAAHGLGAETARSFARRGARLELCDIDGEGLRGVKDELEAMGAEVATEIVDVSQAWQMEEFSENVFKRSGRADVLVNNAGVACAGRFEDLSLEDWQWIVGINYWGVIHGCHFFYPRMIEQGGGQVVNIASAAASIPLPLLTTYCSLKAAVLMFSRTLRAEGAAHGIGVTAVCPGFMTTNISKSMRFRTSTDRTPGEKMAGRVDSFFERIKASPTRVAEALVRGVETNRGTVHVAVGAHWANLLGRLSPRLAVAGLRLSLRFMDRFM